MSLAQAYEPLLLELQRCREWIEGALEYAGGTHEFVDVVEAVVAGHMQLWPGEDGCLVTEIVSYPRKKVMNVFLAGGSMEQLEEMYDDLMAWGKAQGCSCASLTGRKGWEKVGKRYGWEPLHITLIKEFDNGER